MKRKFTDDDILRFLFDEMEQIESESFLSALCSDEILWERYEYFQEIVEKTSGLSYEPSEYSCQKIMAYVKETSIAPETNPQKSPYLVGLKAPKLSTNVILMFVLALFGSITIIGSVYQMRKIQEVSTHTEIKVENPINLDWDDQELDNKIDHLQHELYNIRKVQ